MHGAQIWLEAKHFISFATKIFISDSLGINLWVCFFFAKQPNVQTPCLYHRSQIQSVFQDKGSNSEALKALESKLASWTSKEKLSPCEKSVKDLQRQRHKETLATTFNKLGIVVPYDKKTELGYRPLPMSDSKLGVDRGGGGG